LKTLKYNNTNNSLTVEAEKGVAKFQKWNDHLYKVVPSGTYYLENKTLGISL